MPQIVIIADDLTGALDAAAPFVGQGRTVAVATSPAAVGELLDLGADVLSVSTRSREVEGTEAAARVAGVLSGLPAGLGFFKKIDSRMKGNIAAEIGSFGTRPLLVCPAVPDLGRLVVDGAVTGAGVEVPIPVAAALGPLAERAILPDATCHEDMMRALRALPEDGLAVGARGLAMALSSVIFGPRAESPAIPVPEPCGIVVGSTDPVTLAQVEALRAARGDLVAVDAPAGIVPAPTARPASLMLIQAVDAGPAVPPEQVARALAAGAVPWLRHCRTILATGGATAEALFDALGAAVLTLVGEAAPGLPVCRWKGRLLVTKSGGFGAPDAFARLWPAASQA